MDKEVVFARFVDAGIVPVVRADTEKETHLAIEALLEGGIPIAELTMTIPDAIAVIGRCVRRFADRVIIGAGTVTDPVTCSRAVEAGSQFVVTPTVKTDVVEWCRKERVCVIGGALTPTEILSVREAGADAVKVFPAKAVGGSAYIRMIHEPMPHIPIVPTGGVTLETLADYFRAGAIFVGSGGDLVSRRLLKDGDRAAITKRAVQYLSRIKEIRTELSI
ncbi:MAG: bifunctional 4-hydroxy-2-oxoglutarate aldolase/2-dehydro-3-deoxy-phosphogluconate aldolase [Deltaproteobacteria bacterium]|nr:bifunctional 4-hydroxy-2-oxoglutarate aldolase/2-dehydro-3-deoxy-phosphogluconate aldolase [Deltaproteobacteria bacterium]